jgi:hypothetical protein
MYFCHPIETKDNENLLRNEEIPVAFLLAPRLRETEVFKAA